MNQYRFAGRQWTALDAGVVRDYERGLEPDYFEALRSDFRLKCSIAR
jgi:hypothetical protein